MTPKEQSRLTSPSCQRKSLDVAEENQRCVSRCSKCLPSQNKFFVLNEVARIPKPRSRMLEGYEIPGRQVGGENSRCLFVVFITKRSGERIHKSPETRGQEAASVPCRSGDDIDRIFQRLAQSHVQRGGMRITQEKQSWQARILCACQAAFHVTITWYKTQMFGIDDAIVRCAAAKGCIKEEHAKKGPTQQCNQSINRRRRAKICGKNAKITHM